ncbi:hypothetical protein Patl1_11956 [Pistacia atlantica]|uniref:Uncharacterized protein n=1 Tax=Pistacia atlantica TaxID=434234 RepID=A0ACC1A2G5_9ROSI|nr:hypothetical protein Patl1_11956 [Pistacia atlantica]
MFKALLRVLNCIRKMCVSPNKMGIHYLHHIVNLQICFYYYVPNYILVAGSEATNASHIPACPVIVFLNSRRGGQLGGELLVSYRSLLNENQVFDLGEKAPDKVLHELYANLEKLRHAGDVLAAEILKKLRIIVAGGDGTAGWLLGVVSDLKLSHPPPIATVPLGTGNNLPFAFGWGKKNPSTDRQSVLSFMEQVKNAKEMKIDRQCIHDGLYYMPLELLIHGITTKASSGTRHFSVFIYSFIFPLCGMDAQVSYAFHSERKLHPEKFQNQLVNQSTYLKLAGTQGSFASLSQPSSQSRVSQSINENIAQLAKVKIMKKQGVWEDLDIPRSSPTLCLLTYSIRSIVCLNLPSFSGGLDPWGKPLRKKIRESGLTPPYVDDGLIEIVGFRDAWHGLVLLAPNGHGTRLAQVAGRSINDLYLCRFPDEETDSVEDEYDEDGEEQRKFGAADTFKIPDGVAGPEA